MLCPGSSAFQGHLEYSANQLSQIPRICGLIPAIIIIITKSHLTKTRWRDYRQNFPLTKTYYDDSIIEDNRFNLHSEYSFSYHVRDTFKERLYVGMRFGTEIRSKNVIVSIIRVQLRSTVERFDSNCTHCWSESAMTPVHTSRRV